MNNSIRTILISIATALSIGAITVAATAVVNVARLDEREKSLREHVIEIKKDVSWIKIEMVKSRSK